MKALKPVNRNKPVPLSAQVAEAVLSAVRPGATEVLPSRNEMAAQLGVGLSTLNQAITRLKVGGFASEALGVGTLVRRPANGRRPHLPASARLVRHPRHEAPDLWGAGKAIRLATAIAEEVGGDDALRLAYWACHYVLGYSYQTIGAVFGRDQTTVWELAHACAAGMDSDPALAKKARKISRSLASQLKPTGRSSGAGARRGSRPAAGASR